MTRPCRDKRNFRLIDEIDICGDRDHARPIRADTHDHVPGFQPCCAELSELKWIAAICIRIREPRSRHTRHSRYRPGSRIRREPSPSFIPRRVVKSVRPIIDNDIFFLSFIPIRTRVAPV